MQIIVAQRVKELMGEEGINQTELADKLGVDSSTVCTWVNGKKEPNITSLWLLADYFDVSVDYLIGRKDF